MTHIITGDLDGEQIFRDRTVYAKLDEIIPKEEGIIMNVDDAKALYYKTHSCTYDDYDQESALISKWFELNNITITD